MTPARFGSSASYASRLRVWSTLVSRTNLRQSVADGNLDRETLNEDDKRYILWLVSMMGLDTGINRLLTGESLPAARRSPRRVTS